MLDTVLVFSPHRTRPTDLTPAGAGLLFEDVYFSASDDVKLHGWFIPGASDVTMLWFHGSGSNIGDDVYSMLTFHQRLEASIFIFDYRGFGLSHGKASERGTYRDAEAALVYLRSRLDVNPSRIVLYGYSLGTAVAVEMATREQAHAVILESPFTPLAATARKRHPRVFSWLPVGLVIRSQIDSLSKIKDVHSPVMILHGNQDESVPIDLGRELFAAANEPKTFYTVAGGGHDTYIAAGEPYYAALEHFIKAATARPG